MMSAQGPRLQPPMSIALPSLPVPPSGCSGNRVRFPPDLLFILTREEIRDISHIVTCSTIKHARSVSASTEQEAAMLSSVLHSERAAQVNVDSRDSLRPQCPVDELTN